MLSQLALSTALTVIGGAGVDPALPAYAWENRPILVFAEADDPLLAQQLARFKARAEALIERDNVVIVDTEDDSRLRRAYRPDGFTVILVGKDGGEKLRRTDLVSVEELNGLIDRMPMRRTEMLRQRADSVE